tara:strand:+ start:989 stop:1597 length:609 start_codon:yes stop_codon:yes gene_type:complete
MPETVLDEFDCSDNFLTLINDEQYVNNLTYLCCANNKLIELPNNLKSSPLRELYCYNNKLENLPLPNTIQVLHCQNNSIVRLPGIYFTNLDTMDCSHNKLIDLQLYRCHKLKKCDASHNDITKLTLLSKRVKWSLGHNPIIVMDILRNKHLIRCKDINSLHLVEKYPFRKHIPVTFDIRQYIESFFWIDIELVVKQHDQTQK